jgi:Helicase conserved C-terminal domain
MTDYLGARDAVTEAVRRELLGPATTGRPLDAAAPISFGTTEDAFGPWLTLDGQELLDRDQPTRRYGVGVLYPHGPAEHDPPSDEVLDDVHPPDDDSLPIDRVALDELDKLGRRGASRAPELNLESDELDLSSANELRQSAVAVTFLLQPEPRDFTLRATVTGGRYEPVEVLVAGAARTWWVRKPVSLEVTFGAEEIAAPGRRLATGTTTRNSQGLDLELDVAAFGRDHTAGGRLVTVSVTNRTRRRTGPLDTKCLFQTGLVVRAEGPRGGVILPYPSRGDAEAEPVDGGPEPDEEDQSIELLYRHAQTFGIGHGCAAEWTCDEAGDAAVEVAASMLPAVELPSITPDIMDEQGKSLRVSMARLAGLDPGHDGIAEIEAMLGAYDRWIASLRVEPVPPRLTAAAAAHISACERMLDRMRDGLAYLRSDPLATRAFRLANEAMLEQQLRARRRPRAISLTKDGRFTFSPVREDPDWRSSPMRGYWRPFQIGFLLATARSLALAEDPDRELVDLVFFPTGGGKTEAYLGQTAFAVFLRRLRDPRDSGVQVLMRYTLRLLTAQQFERASALICAMDLIRARGEALGSEIAIGIWLGGSMTPNSRKDALARVRALARGDRDARNPFLLRKCPWCSAQMGSVTRNAGGRGRARVLAGYRESGGSVELYCPDRDCPFSTRLPVEVVDEDIYERRPALIIGTIDKFAAVAWRSEVRSLFGLDGTGARQVSPPGLVIQDELHLISGPLGSLAGLYETLIEELCIDRRKGVVRPKIVASTATIRRYRQQVLALYSRERVSLFPPHGLSARDSFFGRVALASDGRQAPGRRYLGVYAPGLGSIQTAEVRTLASLLQAAVELPDPTQRDPWYTLVAFFNSLRELANSLTLLQSDIPDYLKAIRNREGLGGLRQLRHIKELTSRLGDEEIPAAIEDLERPAGTQGAVDICLASSIIEVGMDIERLSLMTLLGQPKSTSQYIQVTGRIGRVWSERPGLVVVIYGAAKPRDRSHYERFRSYHERLYAAVEATSATPFALPVLERALHAVLVGYTRQFGPAVLRPWPVPGLAATAAAIVRDRARGVDPSHLADLDAMLRRRLDEWDRFQATTWSVSTWRDDAPDDPLIRGAGEWAPEAARPRSWPTLRSMRNVDAGCRLAITPAYAIEAVQGPSSGDAEAGDADAGDVDAG